MTENFMHRLPPELIKSILIRTAPESNHIRVHNDSSFMTDHQWVRVVSAQWFLLRNPQEASNVIERSEYRTKKAIVLVCKLWHRLGLELLYQSILVEKPEQLGLLAQTLRSNSELGWWIQRITIHPYIPSSEPASSGVASTLISILSHPRNLGILKLVSWFPDDLTASIAANFPPSLRHLKWTIPKSSINGFILVLSQFTSLEYLELEVEDKDGYKEVLSSYSPARLPNLRSVSLRGHLLSILTAMNSWNMPRLQSLGFHFFADAPSQQLAAKLVDTYGSQLKSLDLDTITAWDVPKVLQQCLHLTEFSFNPDWPLPRLSNQPHPKIVDIGLHDLWYTFEVGQGALFSQLHPIRAGAIRTSNDRNITRITREAFPNLRRVRVLDSKLLHELQRAKGPPPRAIDYWQSWMRHANQEGFRLEDCAGNLLGTIPTLEPPEPDFEFESSETEGTETEGTETDEEEEQ